MEDNSKHCIKVNATTEEIKECLCIDCIHYVSLEDRCGYEDEPNEY